MSCQVRDTVLAQGQKLFELLPVWNKARIVAMINKYGGIWIIIWTQINRATKSLIVVINKICNLQLC